MFFSKAVEGSLVEACDVEVLNWDAGGYMRSMAEPPSDPWGPDFSNTDISSEQFFDTWRNLDDIEAFLTETVGSSGTVSLEALLPETHEGRNIKAVRIRGSGWVVGQPRVLLTFTLHAREWLPTVAGVRVADLLIQRATSTPSDFENVEVVIGPLVNPDGFAHAFHKDRLWRKNRRSGSRTGEKVCDGVDLNRNWDVDWNGGGSTSVNPCSDTFVGAHAHSEPEVQAMLRVIAEAPVSVHIDVHAFSRVILRPWSCSMAAHPQVSHISALGERMQAAMLNSSGRLYELGGNEILYRASGTFSDYTTSQGAFGYTVELPPTRAHHGLAGFIPDKASILPTSSDVFAAALEVINWARVPGRVVLGSPTQEQDKEKE